MIKDCHSYIMKRIAGLAAIAAFAAAFALPVSLHAIEKPYAVAGTQMGETAYSPVNGMLVFQSDFGLRDGAVSAMKGVAMGVSPDLKIFDITHEIPAGKIWDAAFRLHQTVTYWPQGTVFVSVVDPGVGSSRSSIVALLESGHYIVTPDNGTITLLSDTVGIKEIRIIDEETNRLPDSFGSNTFHGRDVYAYTGARLASKVINFEQVGPVISKQPVKLKYSRPEAKNGIIHGCINITDVQYGNLWTDIGWDIMRKIRMAQGKKYNVSIQHNGKTVYSAILPFCKTFSDVPAGKPLLYVNSLGNLSIALNMGNFVKAYGISYGESWKITVSEK